MKDTEFKDLLQFSNMGGSALIPENQNAVEFVEQLKNGENVWLKSKTERDLGLHRAYFLMLAEVWGYLPKKFRDNIPKEKFYLWLKLYNNNYNVIFEFKDGRQFIEYESISFGRMDNNKFKEYVKMQIPVWYRLFTDLLPEQFANDAIETIEQNFERTLQKL